MAGVGLGGKAMSFCVALCCPVSIVCATPVSFNSCLKLCPVPCLCHLLVPMSFCLDFGFAVHCFVCLSVCMSLCSCASRSMHVSLSNCAQCLCIYIAVLNIV